MLEEAAGVQGKYDLMRFDSPGAVSTGMFDEDWRRLVVEMATGSGGTKVMSLLVTWCYFHRLYREGSRLARNFLIISPNIIVPNQLRAGFETLRIFRNDPLCGW